MNFNNAPFHDIIYQLINWCLEPGHIGNPEQLLSLAETMHSRKDYTNAFQMCKNVRKRIAEIQEIDTSRKLRLQEIAKLDKECNDAIQAWKTMPEESYKMLISLKTEEATAKPKYLFENHANLLLKTSKLMLTIAIESPSYGFLIAFINRVQK